MRPIPHLYRLTVAVILLASACGGEDATHSPMAAVDAPAPVLVSGDVPLPAVGRDELPPVPPAKPAPGAPLSEAVKALPSSAVVAPRPDLSAPIAAGGTAGEKPFSPHLSGRDAAGNEVLEFPLAHTRVVAQVSGNVARVEVTQYYANPSRDRLEAIYAFPLPPNAAVTDMLFRIGDRVVLSEVKRREEAKRTYEKAKREGKTAALTEQERPNLFTQSVANVPPGAMVAVVLRYVHEVPFDDGRYLFHFPTTVGPRYIPGTPVGASGPGWSPDTDRVPDASRVTPPVLPPGKQPSHDVDVLVRLVPGTAFDDVVAKSHRVVTGLDSDGARVVALAEDDRVPNKDLVLTWRPAGTAPAAHALLQRERGEEFVLIFAQPPAEVAPSLVRPKELVFLVDKSGSMSGAPIDRAKALIARALGALGPDDTFQVIAFDGAAQAMTAAPVPGTPENVKRAATWLNLLEGGGGTEMLTGIRAALTAPADPRRLRMVVFCTDGFIGNEAEIIAAVESLRGSARVFGFGIGESVNRFLVEGVGRAGRGASEVVNLKEVPDAAVERLFRRIDRPVLTDLEASFEGAEVADVLPARLPDLLAGQPLVVAARVRSGTPRAVVLRGRLGEKPWQARIPVAGAPHAGIVAEQPVAGTLWARRRVDALLPEGPPPSAAAVEEVVALALRFKLVTRHTSFVAVERELRVDPTLPMARSVVPNALPEGVSYEGIFGPAREVKVLPGRVKPGDPELRVDAGPDAVAVRVELPFDSRPRDAVRDPRRGDFVLRFLVPPAWPDGSFDARIHIRRGDGSVEERVAPIRVDTTAAAVAVVAAPSAAEPGEEIRVALKPALPATVLPALAARPGGLGNALKGAMEVKEILVRAPWGEIARARMDGPLGVWVAVLRVPADAAAGRAELEIVASDAAGNVSRRRLGLAIREGAAVRPGEAVAEASVAGVAVGAVVLAVAVTGALLLRRRSAPRPLGRRLLASTLRRADDR